MSIGHALQSLAARWVADPQPTVCAALADGLRKRGELSEALALLHRGIDQFPDHVPLRITRGRVALALGDREAARDDLRWVLDQDRSHPVARELAAQVAPDLLAAAASATPSPEAADAEPIADAEAEDDAAPALVTESLAVLYHRQGHLALAVAAYAELAGRNPENQSLVSRHEALRRELAASQPVPFDARVSGGRSVAEWFARLGAAAPPIVAKPRTGFDAFYEPPPLAPAPPATADFDAFQRWLHELDR